MKWWQDELSKRSNGRVTIKLYENAVLGELKAHYDLVLAGTADIVFFVSGHEPGRFPMSEILELPTFTPSGEIRSPAVAATARKYVEPYDYMDVKNLTWANPGGWDLFTAKKPVRSLADFKGLKVFVSSPAQAKAMEACGAVPVVMDASEIYTAVERGVLDGIVFHWGGADGFNFHKICKYVTKIGIGGAVHSSAMNLKTWKSLPPGVKRIFEDLLKEAPVVMGRMYDDQDKKVVEKFKAEGMEIIELPEAERKAVYDKFAVVFDEWVARRGRDGYPTREAVDFLLAETEKSIAEWVRTHPE